MNNDLVYDHKTMYFSPYTGYREWISTDELVHESESNFLNIYNTAYNLTHKPPFFP